ncbi:nectin-2 [Eurytemora carolleeae]|uniref:nectin-2 n=1 Tax=Eurytemora carolleeae TaxID=1294199 RepID=UPI000C76BA4A|nr:nectin-2 [Eurytemora carolleeae]|eukprot:XP_023326844.1 nectin-2-like [Eurytemora affinis]
MFILPMLNFFPGSSGTELVDIAGVEGGSVSLPCPCFPPTPSTLVSLVMWFHNSAQDPFFSFDSRGPGADGRHWVSHQYSERVALNLILQENTFILHLFNLSLNDQGAFRCRVDFDTAPTQNVHINLSIIVPPSTPVLLDGWGAIIGSTFGPFKEGDTASLSCEVRGGKVVNKEQAMLLLV